MKIHGVAYILVGIFIAGFSFFISNMNGAIDIQKFMLFIWIGVAFVIVGFVKILFFKKTRIAKENFHHHRPKKQQIQSPAHQTNQHPDQLVKFCSGCGNAVRHFDNFCYKCGSRIFHRK